MPLTVTPLQLGIRSNPTRYSHEGNARLTNCYAEQLGEEGKNPWAIYAIPGFIAFSTIGTNAETRAMLEVEGTLYVVSGQSLYRIDIFGNATSIGAIGTDGLVTIARNRASTLG